MARPRPRTRSVAALRRLSSNMVPSLGLHDPSDPFYARTHRWPTSEVAKFGMTRSRDFLLLSNMATLATEVGQIVAPSSESLYQAAKFPAQRDLQLKILQANGREAKSLAHSSSVPLSPKWRYLRRRAMLVALCLKLMAHPEVFACLAQTEKVPIVEVSNVDDFWGAVVRDHQLVGTNMLGRLWMSVRELDAQGTFDWRAWALSQQRALWPASYS